MAKLQSGTIVYGNLTVNTFANINGNLILGAQIYAAGSPGVNGQVLQNVGGTGVAWANPSAGSSIFNGTSNVTVLSSGSNVVISVGGAIIANVGSTGLTVMGGISAGTFTGNGAGLTGINTGGLSYAITSGGSNVTVTASNVNVSVNGSNVASFGTYGLTVLSTSGSTSTTSGALQVAGGVGIGGNLFAGQINTTGNILATNAILNALTVNGGITSTGTINTSGNVEAAVGTFNGLVLNGTITGVSSITASGLINTTANISTAQLNAGQINTTGNILSTGAVHNALTVNGTITATGYINTTANISAAVANFGNLNSAGASIVVINSIAPAGNAAVTLGNLTNQWSTIYGKATTAQYADLAEIYTSDKKYVPGTVLVFGGNEEVTISTLSHDPRIAGVVSTNPAYLMNSTETGVQVALTGRVPCRVLGPVRKGDRLVASEHAGIAQRLNGLLYEPGCIIGKALEEIDEPRVHTIEVVVGRL